MRTINLLNLLLFCFCIIPLNQSCSQDNSQADAELTISTEALSFAKGSETKTMNISTNVPWTITSSEAWCQVTPSSGKSTGTIEIKVSVAKNTIPDTRNTVLTVVAEGISKQITVTQAQIDLLVVKQGKYEVTAKGGEIAVELQTTAAHTTVIGDSWITKSATRSVSNTTDQFIIAPNTTFTDREGSIRFTVNDLTETVIIHQKGIESTTPSDKTGMDNDALALASKMGIGWNLGNSLEACSGITSANETSWGNPKTTKTMIDAVKAAGFNTVRIPCAWSGYTEDQTTYKIKDSWLARVKEVVDYCVNNNMYAIINIHWDGGWLEENPFYSKKEEVNKKQKALWQQIAVYFRDYDEHLLFAGTNEVHAGYGTPTSENIEVQLSYNQTFIDAVRATGGKNAWRNLIVQAYNTNIEHAVNHLKMPQDGTVNRTMAEVHFYDPWDFCGQEDSNIYLWGKNFTGSNVSVWGQEGWVDEAFGKMKTNFVNRGIPVILGEHGAIRRSSLSSSALENHIKARNYYLNYVTKAALKNGMVPVYWDNGYTGNNGFGLFNRNTATQVYTDAIQAIIGAAQ